MFIPGGQLILTACGKTDRGLIRERNEDNFYLNEKQGLFFVADGMGGHAGGQTASRLAIEALCDYLRKNDRAVSGDASYSSTTNRLHAAIQYANAVVYNASQTSRELEGMGTTVAAAVLDGNRLSIAHVGDSRVYLVRSGTMEQLTDDHSVVQEHVRQQTMTQDQARCSGMKNILTRALGIEAETRADLTELTLLSGDVVLLCSDGLYNMVSERTILRTLAYTEGIDRMCDALIDEANENGGQDNITVIVASIHQKTWYKRFGGFMKGLWRYHNG